MTKYKRKDFSLREKNEKLHALLADMGKVCVAYSGGVDSTFLAAVAHDVLGNGAAAITAKTELNPSSEYDQAQRWCESVGMRQFVLCEDALAVPGFAENPPDRCYLCKRNLFTRIKAFATENNLGAIVDGSNMDDLDVYRPGARALSELGVRSPLQEAGLRKDEIRALSREMGLPTWDKPSLSCLASRFPYDSTLTLEGLKRVAAAEALLTERGFKQVRVRVHDNIARIEVEPERIEDLVAIAQRDDLAQRFHELGFAYVTADLEGFRSGSLDEPGLSSGKQELPPLA